MINARAETVAEKPSFGDSFRRRRCLVPADSFYEWSAHGKTKVPTRIFLNEHKIFAFAGIWDSWKSPDGKSLETFAILTQASSDFVSSIHDRMPVFFEPGAEAAAIASWLDPKEQDPQNLLKLIHPRGAINLEGHRVSTTVNSPKSDVPECIEKDPQEAWF